MQQTFDLAFVFNALDFAARRHATQRRRGDVDTPYVNHVIEVANLVAGTCSGATSELVATALLHDILPHGLATAEEMAERFGPRVLSLLYELAMDRSLPRDERIAREIETVGSLSREAKIVKIADKLSSVLTLTEAPPPDWTHVEKLHYIDWADTVVANCSGVCPKLEEKYRADGGRIRATLKGLAGVA